MEHSPGDEPRPSRDSTVVGCHSYMKPVGGNVSVAEPTTKGYKGENLFIFFSFLSFSFTVAHCHGIMRADSAVAGGGFVV